MVIGETADEAAAGALARRVAAEVFAGADAGGRYVALLDEAPADASGWSFAPSRVLFVAGRHGARAGEWLFRVGLRVPAAQRDELLAWYRDEHLPILLECAAWDGCRFVEAATDGRFFALHQLSDRSALESPERARSRATPWFHRLKRYDWFDESFTRTLYRRLSHSE
jgi:hypothetical protein